MTTTQMRKTPLLVAVDGNSLVHRAHHAMERTGLRGPDGRPTWATKGFCSLLIAVCERYRPDALIIGFDDAEGDAIRKQKYPLYKATRSAKAPELYEQLADIPAMMRAMGAAVVVPPRLEADDVLASAAAAGTEAGWKTIVVTSDRDSFALVSATTAVLRVVNGGIDQSPLVTTATLSKHAQCGPGQYTDYAALRGDTSDNLPGAKGIGEKTAGLLLATFPDVRTAWAAYEADPASVEAVIGRANAAKLVTPEARENVERNLDLMAMRTDVPIPDLGGVAALPLDPDKVLAALAERGLDAVRRPALAALCRTDLTPPAPPAQEQIPLPEPPPEDYDTAPAAPHDPQGVPEQAPQERELVTQAAFRRPVMADLLTTAGYSPAPARPRAWSVTL